MKVGELKKLLYELSDDLDVVLPCSHISSGHGGSEQSVSYHTVLDLVAKNHTGEYPIKGISKLHNIMVAINIPYVELSIDNKWTVPITSAIMEQLEELEITADKNMYIDIKKLYV